MSFDKFVKSLNRERLTFLQMMLGKLNIYMEKNEAGSYHTQELTQKG